eukprot:6477079-Pyramimonas_sp.AAC.1
MEAEEADQKRNGGRRTIVSPANSKVRVVLTATRAQEIHLRFSRKQPRNLCDSYSIFAARHGCLDRGRQDGAEG